VLHAADASAAIVEASQETVQGSVEPCVVIACKSRVESGVQGKGALPEFDGPGQWHQVELVLMHGSTLAVSRDGKGQQRQKGGGRQGSCDQALDGGHGSVWNQFAPQAREMVSIALFQ
jgi:hypothetical protein